MGSSKNTKADRYDKLEDKRQERAKAQTRTLKDFTLDELREINLDKCTAGQRNSIENMINFHERQELRRERSGRVIELYGNPERYGMRSVA